MDANKAEKLREIAYVIMPCCALCEHGRFGADPRGAVQAVFGVCAIQSYDHLKHTGPPRQLSVSAFGRCRSFVLSDRAVTSPWAEFYQT